MFFWPKRHCPTEAPQTEVEVAQEIRAHRIAKQRVIREAHDTGEQLNKMLIENGFTLKLYLAAGGQHPRSQKGRS